MEGSDAAILSVFNHLFASVAEEMGVALGRTSFSPNIKERRDFSCAVFTGDGRLLAQAAHIPVHLGAMPASVEKALAHAGRFEPGDVVILNDPYLGGTHLPDITMVSPVFVGADGDPAFFVASRAHHADIGGISPGSMPLSTELFQEGIIIPPVKLVAGGVRNEELWKLLLSNVRTPTERAGDLNAQLAAHDTGAKRLAAIIGRYSLRESLKQAYALIDYARRMTEAAIAQIAVGNYRFADYLDDDGQGLENIEIRAELAVHDTQIHIDFAGTAPAVRGNLNAVPAIVESAAAYCLRCVALALIGSELPMNAGSFAPLSVRIPPGSLLDPTPPHAVAAGNVETSQRVVDVVFGALAQAIPDVIPAASQGTMNNLSFGGTVESAPFAYYETLGGGAGAGMAGAGGSGVHVHMSNTRNTPVEALELAFPVRVEAYGIREGSGGNGLHRGGDGLIRRIRFLAPATATITSERRLRAPYGLAGGVPGSPGRNRFERDGIESVLPGKCRIDIEDGDVLEIATPGGGGWGSGAPENVPSNKQAGSPP